MFEQATLDEATQRAKASGKLLLIDFTAKWCGPCAKMDRTTWAERSVHEWVREHAIAIQLDADENEALCREWNIKTLPNVLVRRDGAELDRAPGYQNAMQLLTWLDGVLAGKTRLDALRTARDTDVTARFRLAQELLNRGAHDEALGHFVWLWEHALEFEPGWVGVRSSFLIGALEPLVDAHEPARERFEALRAATKDFGDWVTLSVLLEHEEEIVARVEKLSSEEAEALHVLDEPRVIEVLDAHSALGPLGRLLTEPKQRLLDERARFRSILEQEVPGELRVQLIANLNDSLEQKQDVFARALEHAGRTDEAAAVRELELAFTD